MRFTTGPFGWSAVLRAVAADFFCNCRCLEIPWDNRIGTYRGASTAMRKAFHCNKKRLTVRSCSCAFRLVYESAAELHASATWRRWITHAPCPCRDSNPSRPVPLLLPVVPQTRSEPGTVRCCGPVTQGQILTQRQRMDHSKGKTQAVPVTECATRRKVAGRDPVSSLHPSGSTKA
jgi:hypothetical protein